MSEVKHTQLCQGAQATRAAWLAQWPDHCPICEGQGEWQSPGSYWEPPDGGACSCVENGFCPRCHGVLEFRDRAGAVVDPDTFYNDCFAYCPACGWDENPANRQPDFACLDVCCMCDDMDFE